MVDNKIKPLFASTDCCKWQRFYKQVFNIKSGAFFVLWILIVLIAFITSEWISIYYPTIAVKSNNIKVIDGDTIMLDNKRIRLKGIDTPEIKQQCLSKSNKYIDCGVAAKINLKQIIANKTLECSNSGTDKYQRHLAYCFVNGTNINLELVKQGYARNYLQNNIFFIYYETVVKINKIGLWNTKFEKPGEWRKLHSQKTKEPTQILSKKHQNKNKHLKSVSKK